MVSELKNTINKGQHLHFTVYETTRDVAVNFLILKIDIMSLKPN